MAEGSTASAGGGSDNGLQTMHAYQCSCGNTLFFENSRCVQCGLEVGYEPASDRMVVLDDQSGFVRCANGTAHAVCNWVVPAGGGDALCISCRLNRTIPDITLVRNVDAWHKIEIAKRRTLFTLARVGLRPVPKVEDPVNGLVFDFLRPDPGYTVLTGHADGVITVNVDEAEDSARERQREMLGEPWRTLIGHFRHEMAHYYWDRFFKDRADGDPYLEGFREVFGDERKDYAGALATYYASGPGPMAPGEFISVYASVHPWEDWAEVWAHYLHMMDGTETAEAFGFDSRAVPIPFTPFPADVSALPGNFKWERGEGRRFLSKLHDWAKLAPALNELGASLGHPALYPFVFSEVTIRKLCFVHFIVHTLAAELTQPTPASPESPSVPVDAPESVAA